MQFIVPFNSDTYFLTIDTPMPNPVVLSLLFICVNSLNIFSIFSLDIPGPLSIISKV